MDQITRIVSSMKEIGLVLFVVGFVRIIGRTATGKQENSQDIDENYFCDLRALVLPLGVVSLLVILRVKPPM